MLYFLDIKMKIIRTSQSKIDTAIMLVVRENQVLILKRGPTAPWEPNKWNLPGGGIEDGEASQVAAMRECSEEASITPSNVSHLGTYGNIDAYVGFVETNVEAIIDFESSDKAWINSNEIGNFEFVYPVPKIISDYFNSTKENIETEELSEDITRTNYE